MRKTSERSHSLPLEQTRSFELEDPLHYGNVVIITLRQARASDAVGAKAFTLGRLLREGFPVPSGFCVPADSLASLESEDFAHNLQSALDDLHSDRVAVRSSALDEDAGTASHAGVVASVPNVAAKLSETRAALREVRDSAASPSVNSYRAALGLTAPVRMAALVQTMLEPRASGVLFTVHPITRQPSCLVESFWGTGQVTDGRLIPDRFTVDDAGHIVEFTNASTQRMLGTGEGPTASSMAPQLQASSSLTYSEIQELVSVGRACEALLGCPQDIEWAFDDDQLWILQSRPITA
jgi:pyruvate,water dikinase